MSIPARHQTGSLQARNTAPAEEQSVSAAEEQARSWPWVNASATRLALAVAFGGLFGFLLQKGGVAQFDILIGVLLLEDFTVIKVMLSAITVGMVGVYLLARAEMLELKIKETVYGASIVGGLLFGVGFGLIAYCPGTAAAAVGQGNLDALVGIVGMVLGSYLFALSSRFTDGTVSTWGKRGKITLPQLLGLPVGRFVAIAAPLLAVLLVLLEIMTSASFLAR